MIVQFTLNQSDHYCLLKHVGKNSTAHEALFNAAEITHPEDGGTCQSWEVRCSPTDAIGLLKLAHQFCPQAAADIRRGIDLSL